MRWTRKLRLRLRSLFRSHSVEQELTEELQYHLERLIDDRIAAGASPDDARYAALREMGAMEQRKEECRDARGLRLIEAVGSDLRYSVRQLRKYPVFTAAAVLTIAIGIGPNATMATIISSVFRPLPVGDADRLAVLATTMSGNPRIWQRVAYPDLQDYRASETPFSDMAAWDLSPVGLTVDGRTDRLMATAVSGNYFSTLRLDPAAGRLILPSDGELGGTQPIAVLSHSYWSRRFGASPSIVGREVRIDGRPFTVVGVAPENFHGTFTLLSSELYVPLELFQSQARLSNRDVLAVRVIARLKSGVALDQARASMDTVARRLEGDHPATNAGRRIRVYWERLARLEPQNASQAPVLAALFLMLVGAILLIACANVLGLFLAKGLGRGREMAIRRALGASRSDLVRLCVVEALVICISRSVWRCHRRGRSGPYPRLGGSHPWVSFVSRFPTRLDDRELPRDPNGRFHTVDWAPPGTQGVASRPAQRSFGRQDLHRRPAATTDPQGLGRRADCGLRGAARCVWAVHSKRPEPAIGGSRLRCGSCSAGLDGSGRRRVRRRQSAGLLRVARHGSRSAPGSGIRCRVGLRPIRDWQFDSVHRGRGPATAVEHHRASGRPTSRHG